LCQIVRLQWEICSKSAQAFSLLQKFARITFTVFKTTKLFCTGNLLNFDQFSRKQKNLKFALLVLFGRQATPFLEN